MASAAWQEELRQRLVERNRKELAYAGIIEQYRRLSQQTRLLKERNQSLLRAVGTARSTSGGASTSSGSGADTAVQTAYIASLESQISSLRDEMAAVYKTQGQNAQRLLSMNETLREKEELARIEAEALRKARDEIATSRRKVEQHEEIMLEKDRSVQILNDEIQSLTLELNQVISRNEALKVDNATLLQRWLDRVDEEAQKMNSANTFYEDMRSRGWKSTLINSDTTTGSSQGGANSSVNGDGPDNDDDESPFLNLQDDKGSTKIEPLRNPNG
ncbi:autophagy protein 16-domain-containing protein [Cantharellus anzutake]|uniref:autophagy protein 16-domain-containing protein n=1 Tax=Cantharellus anzutake TaxID=1750568 RepID=UPI001907E4B8|nr:autophagy protein 16-domain-containing protein [Cantharellus anzutake]XP_038910371.1 autophagy protein 16-domain-containing protein [Cantharellus anzutake]KAF8313368.1 autophagy protein 16-domain-containing protein [Cantharellus anzutake]KAF8320570.1 autophagy protein 16-domain-containing protein [Cantharellus anzutake]